MEGKGSLSFGRRRAAMGARARRGREQGPCGTAIGRQATCKRVIILTHLSCWTSRTGSGKWISFCLLSFIFTLPKSSHLFAAVNDVNNNNNSNANGSIWRAGFSSAIATPSPPTHCTTAAQPSLCLSNNLTRSASNIHRTPIENIISTETGVCHHLRIKHTSSPIALIRRSGQYGRRRDHDGCR